MNDSTFWPPLWNEQCDHIAQLLAKYLAIYNNENLPNSISILPKWVKYFSNN